MSDRQNWSRLVASIFALTLVSAFAFAAFAPKYYTSLFTAEANSVEQTAEPSATILKPLTIGTCDTGGPIEIESSGGATTPTAYATLAAAIVAINTGTHQGVINVEVCASSTEAGAMFLNSGDAAPASYTSVNIYPIADGLTISGPSVQGRGLIELNGADNVTIDGDNPNTAGTNRNLTITNTAVATTTLTSVIRVAVLSAAIVPTANNNTIKNLNLNGSATGRNAATNTSTTASENSTFGIYAGGLATGATTAPAVLTSVTTNTAASGTTINLFNVTNNAVNACARGIFFNGAAATVSNLVTIADNLVGDQATTLVGAPPYIAPTTTVYTKPIWVSGTTAFSITGNSVKNILSYVGTGMIGIEINSAIGTGPLTISNNTVNGVVNNGTVSGGFGIGFNNGAAGATYTVSGNTVNNIQALAGVTVSGIQLSTTGTPVSAVVEKNRVSKVYSNSTGGFGSYGINLANGNAVTVQNNFVWDINAFLNNAAISSSFGPHGLRLAAGLNHKVYHNSVNLSGAFVGASSQSLSSALTIVSTTSTGMDVRNNIFANTMTGAFSSTTPVVAMFLPAGATSAMNLTLNNNDYFQGSGTGAAIAQAGVTAGTGVYLATDFNAGATTPATNLRSLTSTLSAAGTNDNATKVVDPLFLSAIDLHISVGSPMVDMGASVGVAQDIDGQLRVGAPDIGADEPSGLTPPANDISATAFISPANGSSIATGAAFAPQASFTNSGTATQTSVPVRYRVIDAGMATVCNVTATIPTIAANQTLPVTFPTCTLASPGAFTIKATAENPGDLNPANDEISGTITGVAPVTGSVNVGTGQAYTSLTNAGGIFDALNAAGASGNVTINITSDLTGESGAIALNELAGGFTVLIKPSGANRSITGSSTNSIIRLNGADNVTIDGSLTGGAATGVGGDPALRNLTVQNTNVAATAGSVIAVMQGANSANNNTIKNVNVSGQDPTQTLIGIHIGGNAPGTSPTVASNNNTVVDNCAFQKSILGVFDNGVSAAIPATGNVISHNDLSATGANRLRRGGIFAFSHNGIQITENKVGGIVADEAADAIGIIAGVQNVTTTVVTSGGIYNANISRNRIDVVTSTNTTGFSAVGIAIAGDPLGPNTISNNMISGVSSPGTSPDFTAGIFVAGVTGSNTRLYYNSVSNTGARGAVASQIGSYGVAISGTNPTVELKNNIFYNTQTSGGGVNAKSYSIGMTSTTFTNLDSNYNDFFASGANAAGFRTGSLDTTGTDLANLAAWQTAVSDDANSQEVDPLFVNPITDLHLQAATPLENDGTPIAAVTVDFDGNARSATTPEIGADELFVAVPGTLAFSSATYTVGEAGPTATLTVNRTGGTDGAVTADFAFSGGTATGGAACGGAVDYVNTGGTVSFANGETTKNITVTICNDSVFEGDETFNATLSNVTGGATIGSPNPAAVTITDNETQPTVQFSSSTYSTNEPLAPAGVTPGITINVTLSGASQSTVSVNYASVAGGTATGGASCSAGVDYINAAGTLNIPAGSLGGTFFVTTCIDAVDEPDETVNLALSSPVGATLGVPNTAVLTIVDNDAPAGNVTVNPGAAAYPTLGDAITAINTGTHTGAVTVDINANTTETGPIVLNSSGVGSASYTSLIIRPSADGLTVAGPTTTGRGLLELNGADNVTIDGDNPNTGGTNRNLTFQNTAANTVTFTSVIRIALAITVVNTADNDVVKNLNVVGSSTGRNINTATSTTASENTTFGILAGTGASTTDGTVAPVAITSVSTGVAAGGTANNLTISNNNIVTAARAVSINGTATSVFPGLLINGNSIGNPVAGNADQVTAIGITAQGSTNAIISGNTVWVEGYVASSAAGHGINVGVNSVNITGATIEKNKVNRVRNNNTTTFTAAGINLGGGSSHIVRNNFISGVINDQTAGTGGFGSTFGAYGIRIVSGTGHKIYHNSVHLYGPMGGVTSTNATVGLVISSTTLTGIDVRNNIFSNQITGGSPTSTRHFAVMLPASGTSAMNLTINNNAYYVSPDPQARLANASTSLNAAAEYLVENFDPTQTTPSTNWRAYTSPLSAAGTNDNASFATTAPPPFTSNTDLHIPAGTATRLESGGAAVGVVDDIDLETRNATTPDIGADEFAGAPAPANDIAAAAFVVPVNGSTIPTGATFSPQASFVNNGTAVQTNVTVRFRIIDAGMTPIYNQTATIATINPLQVVTVTFPSTSVATPGTYTMIANSELAGDANPGNDSISGSFNAVTPVSGTINVGTGGDFTSLTNPGGLFQQLNLAGISSNLTVNITSDLTAETGAVFLNQLAESGAGGYTVTFKPSGAARTVSGTAAANIGLITLNGADRIVFDGSLSGGTDRSLTITNNQTGTSTVIWVRSASASNGSNSNTFKNLVINGAVGATATTTAGILTGSGVTIGGDAEAPNSNNTIQNNWIYRVQNSTYLRGGTTAPVFDQNWTVTGNEFGGNTTADKNIFRGMLIGNSANFTISGNDVHGVQSTGTTTASMSGIQIGLLVSGGTVTRNVIRDIKNISATGTGANAIHFISTSLGSNVTVANNFVSDVAATGSATLANNGFGINVVSGSGYKIYHNSVNLNTNQASGTTAAMLVQSTVTAAGALDIRNNIFANTQTAGATRYAFYSGAANTVYTPIDYNDYFSTGSVGFLGSARATLADWQTATGQDANSKAVNPLFVSATDLHLQAASPMINMGIAGTGITTDIDGQTRDANPDIGADEVPVAANPGSLQFSSSTYSVGESGGTATITVNRTGGSDGTVTVDYATVAGGTATGGASCAAGIDYINASGTLTFINGDTSETFIVTICNDATNEPSETVNMALTNPTGGATLGSPSTAVLTITDDDLPPGSLSINDVRMFEGNSGARNFVFTVSYNGPATPVSVQYATANGTATAGVDYLPASGTVTFNTPFGPEGSPAPQTATVTVVVNSDTVKEANETFYVNLSSPTGATIADGQGVGIIIDEDRTYVADFDLDKVSDFSVFRPSESRWYILPSTTGAPRIVDFGSTGDIAVPGDYDADGVTDIATWRPSTGQWYRILSSTSSTQITTWGTNGDKPVQGDYDGDGKTDLAVYRPSTGTWWILRSSNGSTSATPFGISTDRPVQGDYDGDAKTDIALYRDGTWYILRSSDGGVQIASFGIATDKPVSGDFDGDGKYDLAVYRGGVWWILRSLTGTAIAVPWGAASDIPVPADYDADGTTDFAVFRPSTGDWFVIRSSNSVSFGIHWGVNGDVPIPAAYLPQ